MPLRRSRKTAQFEYLDSAAEDVATNLADVGSNLPVGIQLDGGYDQFAVELSVGDLVLCYTDSLIEAKNATGEALQMGGLLRLVGQIDADDPSGFIRSLASSLRRLAASNLTEDDVTCLLLLVGAGSRAQA